MSVRDLTARWQALKESDVACRGENLDALRAMSHEDLVLLAWEALNTVERLEEYDYLQGALEDHLEGPGDFQEGWVIAQSDQDLGWNKWSKAVGGFVYHQAEYAAGPGVLCGNVMVYFEWADAKAALDKMYGVQMYTRIYPVVISAGREPRTTEPRKLP